VPKRLCVVVTLDDAADSVGAGMGSRREEKACGDMERQCAAL